jgi:hypothetical protein
MERPGGLSGHPLPSMINEKFVFRTPILALSSCSLFHSGETKFGEFFVSSITTLWYV